MTRFLDGPAVTKTLCIRRAPAFLRVVVDDHASGGVDALDQLEDEPTASERLFAYQLTERPGGMFVNAKGSRGGFFPIATYRLVAIQPDDATMRNNASWAQWTEDNRALVKHLFKP